MYLGYTYYILCFLSSVGGDIFCEFLEVAVHCVLYNRGLYPAGVFEKRKKYNIPVQVDITFNEMVTFSGEATVSKENVCLPLKRGLLLKKRMYSL